MTIRRATVFNGALKASLLADSVVSALDCVASRNAGDCKWVPDVLGQAEEFISSASRGRNLVADGAIHAGALGFSRDYRRALGALHYLSVSSSATTQHRGNPIREQELGNYADTIQRIRHHVAVGQPLPSRAQIGRCRAFFVALRKSAVLENTARTGAPGFLAGFPVSE